MAEDIRISDQPRLDVLVVADHNHPIPACLELPADRLIARPLLRLVVHAAVAVDAHVGLVEEVGHRHHIGHRVLREIGQPPAGTVQTIQKLRSSSERLSVSSLSQR